MHKARLSQARALLFPKVFVPLGIKKSHYDKDTLSFLHTQENDFNPADYFEEERDV